MKLQNKSFNIKIKNNQFNSTKTIKNNKKLPFFEQIYKNFYYWLAGIQEDDPLPFEIKNIYFIVEFNQNDIVVSYSADDKNLQYFDYGTYFPLEAQYFFCRELSKLLKQFFIKKSISKSEVFNMLNSLVSKAKTELDFLSSKQIFVGERFNKIFV